MSGANGSHIEEGGSDFMSRLRSTPKTHEEPEVDGGDEGGDESAEALDRQAPAPKKGRAKASPKKAAPKGEQSAQVRIVPPRPMTLMLRLVGDSQLVVHRFPDKAKKEMRDKQQGRTQGKKEAKDPVAEWDGARYRLPVVVKGKELLVDAFPAMTIKKSLISATRMLEGIPMTLVRQTVFVNRTEELVPIEHAPGQPYYGDYEDKFAPALREDVVRVGGRAGPGSGTADLRYRPTYAKGWVIPVTVEFLPNLISMEQVINLFAYAGFGCGIGENRPEKTGGNWGLFHIEDASGNRLDGDGAGELLTER